MLKSAAPTTPSSKLRVAQTTTLPPMSETHFQVQSACAGLVFLEGRSDTHESMGVSLANGVAEVTPSQPFLVRVLNLSHQERVLPKNMVLGTVQPHPT